MQKTRAYVSPKDHQQASSAKGDKKIARDDARVALLAGDLFGKGSYFAYQLPCRFPAQSVFPPATEPCGRTNIGRELFFGILDQLKLLLHLRLALPGKIRAAQQAGRGMAHAEFLTSGGFSEQFLVSWVIQVGECIAHDNGGYPLNALLPGQLFGMLLDFLRGCIRHGAV